MGQNLFRTIPQAIVLLISATVLANAQALDKSWANAVETLITSGRLSEARTRLAAQDRHNRESYAGLLLEARLLAAEQHFLESLTVLQRCLAMRQDDPELYKLVAGSAIRLDKLDTAEMALKSAERLTPDDYLVHFHLGALWYTRSRFLDARPELERAVALRPEHLPAQLFMGLTLEELGSELNAIETYRKAIALNESQGGRNELPYLYLGRLLYRMSRIPEAAPLLRNATATNPQSAEAWLWLGKACQSLGQMEDAASALQHSIAADGQLPEPHYVLSRVYLAQHGEQQSVEELERFRKLQAGVNHKDDGRRKRQQ